MKKGIETLFVGWLVVLRLFFSEFLVVSSIVGWHVFVCHFGCGSATTYNYHLLGNFGTIKHQTQEVM